MPEFERNLGKSDVAYGLIYVAEPLREYLPKPGEKIIVYDDEGREYHTKMHASGDRIDGLTAWYKNYPAQIGDAVVITINSDKSIKLALKKEIPEPPDLIEFGIAMEKQLEDFLEKNIEHLEKGLKLYHDENDTPGRQYRTHAGTIDLLCVDNHNNFVVVEIKKEKGSDKTVGQITRYVGWVKENLANNKDVRGIIIVHEIDDKLEYSASILNKFVQIRYYKMGLRFVNKAELLR